MNDSTLANGHALKRFGQHVPDILDCLAQLSNDEVPTPPKLARAMLDQLPLDVWSNPELRWLDPCCKSGVLLREAAVRLLEGLATWEPDFVKRREHIFRNMLFGTSITEMTGNIARRSLYCARDASSDHSVVRFASEAGNLPFVLSEHRFGRRKNGTLTACRICGAPPELERGSKRENYAYSFIHGGYPTKELSGMKFDVIVGNPPYQTEDGGHGASSTPIYQHFVEAAIDMNPKHVLMITPSRWFAGGKGLDKFRARMLKDKHLETLVDYPKLYDCFPGVKIRGGVSYFLWSRDHHGACSVQTMWEGNPVGEPVKRYLDSYDVLIRRNEAVSILEKVRAASEDTLEARVSSRKPFGLATNFHGSDSPDHLSDPVKLYGSQRISWIEESKIPQNGEWAQEWKVLMSAVQGTSGSVETQFLGKPIIAAPGEICTETYLVAGRMPSRDEAELYAAYLRTRFVRFLVSLRKATQHATKDVYAFVPAVPLESEWTDELLYARYGLNEDEISFIESQVKEMLAPDLAAASGSTK
ncbi:UNVERIFIED_ORG: site-specific DNA-methyltransferase (adenine-specific) [Arthrobacter sp. UYEF2]